MITSHATFAHARRALCLSSIVLVAAGGAHAQLTVPGDFPTIQAAITAASDSDTIEVGPGTYAESISFLGKTIAVKGIGGPGVTMIDGSGSAGSVVRFVAGSDAGTRLEGFTIRGGSAIPDPEPLGGGIRVSDSTVTLANCIISGNVAQFGGGVAVTTGSNATFEDCTISENEATGNDSTGGGGAYVTGASVFRRCRILDNRSTGTILAVGAQVSAGGIELATFDNTTLEDCAFSGNTGTYVGALSNLWSQAPLSVTRCVFSDNGGSIAGAALLFASTVVIVDSCRFENHTSPGGAAVLAIGEFGSDLSIRNCEFIGCKLAGFVSGLGTLHIGPGPSLTLEDSRFFANRAFEGGAVAIVADGETQTATIRRCRFEWNVAYSGGAVSLAHNTPTSPTGLKATVSDCTFTNNASVASGVFQLYPGVNLTVDGSAFCGNVGGDSVGAFTDGGGNSFSGGCWGWSNLGSGLPGATPLVPPLLAGVGALAGNDVARLLLFSELPSAPSALFVGLNGNAVPFKGGTLVPVPVHVTVPFVTDPDGNFELKFHWPAGLPSAFDLYYQVATVDGFAPQGVALSNAIRSSTP